MSEPSDATDRPDDDAAFPFMPVPGVWRTSHITAEQRRALEVVAEMRDSNGNRLDIADEADDLSNSEPPELVFLACSILDNKGDVGAKFAIRNVGRDGIEIESHIWVREDMWVSAFQREVPPPYRANAIGALQSGWKTALVLARIVRLDRDTATVELFSKTDQYELTVSRRLVLDEDSARANAGRRKALYEVLREEFEVQK